MNVSHLQIEIGARNGTAIILGADGVNVTAINLLCGAAHISVIDRSGDAAAFAAATNAARVESGCN